MDAARAGPGGPAWPALPPPVCQMWPRRLVQSPAPRWQLRALAGGPCHVLPAAPGCGADGKARRGGVAAALWGGKSLHMRDGTRRRATHRCLQCVRRATPADVSHHHSETCAGCHAATRPQAGICKAGSARDAFNGTDDRSIRSVAPAAIPCSNGRRRGGGSGHSGQLQAEFCGAFTRAPRSRAGQSRGDLTIPAGALPSLPGCPQTRAAQQDPGEPSSHDPVCTRTLMRT